MSPQILNAIIVWACISMPTIILVCFIYHEVDDYLYQRRKAAKKHA